MMIQLNCYKKQLKLNSERNYLSKINNNENLLGSSSLGVVVKMLDCYIIVSEVKLQVCLLSD